MAQTSYASARPIAFAGMLADTYPNFIEPFFNAEASAEIPFGVMCKQGSGDFTCTLLGAITDRLAGIAVHDHATNYGASGGVSPKDAVNILTDGRCYVTVEDAVTPASGVYVRAVVAGAEVKGAFRGTADSTDTILLYGARFVTSAGAGGLAIVEFDLKTHLAGALAATLPEAA